MARGSIEVNYTQTDEARIPDILTEGATLLMDLRVRLKVNNHVDIC